MKKMVSWSRLNQDSRVECLYKINQVCKEDVEPVLAAQILTLLWIGPRTVYQKSLVLEALDTNIQYGQQLAIVATRETWKLVARFGTVLVLFMDEISTCTLEGGLCIV